MKAFIFRPRFNYVDIAVILSAPFVFQYIGWWLILYILIMSVFSVVMERSL